MAKKQSGQGDLTPALPKKWPLPLQALVKSLFIAAYIAVVFLVIYRFSSKLAMASLAASAFIAFGFPNAESSRPKFLLGGYACGIISGFIAVGIYCLLPGPMHADLYAQIIFSAVAVFLAAFLMLSLKLQHPPAAALTVAVVLEKNPFLMGFGAFICVACLVAVETLIHKKLRKYLD